MRTRIGILMICAVISLLLPVACFAGKGISQAEYLYTYNQSITGNGFEDQATIALPLDDAYTYYLANNRTILCRSRYEESYSFAICIDQTSDTVVAVQVFFEDEFLTNANAEEKQMINSIIAAMIDGLCEVRQEKREVLIKRILLNNEDFGNEVQFYDNGFVFQIGYEGNSPVRSATSFSITSVEQDDFNNGLYWTPYNSLEYFDQAGDIAMSEQGFDLAIMYYEQGRDLSKLEQAYRVKADNLLAQGYTEEAQKVLNNAGLDGSTDQAGVNAGSISSFSKQELKNADDKIYPSITVNFRSMNDATYEELNARSMAEKIFRGSIVVEGIMGFTGINDYAILDYR